MKAFLFIGQAPPRTTADIPFGRTRLYEWLGRVGLSKEVAVANSSFTALTSRFPGAKGHGHIPPKLAEVRAERPRIRAVIESVSPLVIVPVGVMALRELTGDDSLRLEHAIGNVYSYTCSGDGSTIPIVPLPHPSGASPWIYLEGNALLLDRALGHLIAKSDRIWARKPAGGESAETLSLRP